MKLKKLLAVLSALCMMTTNINAGHDFIVADAVGTTKSSETLYSGSCGENAVWSFDTESGTLTISGSGDMNNYLNRTRPWEDYANDITSLVIENGITSIGSYSFEYLKNITDVVIPEGVTTIYKRAFFGCNNLSSISLPSSLISIGEMTFYNCVSLESIIIPENVTTIGHSAFQRCKKLVSVSLPSKLKTIRGGTFNDCESLKSVIIPENVTTIELSAFKDCNNLSSISLPASLVKIESQAFYNCNNLSSISLPSSLISIGEMTFYNCVSLESIIIPENVKIIGNSVLYGCTYLTNIEVSPENNYFKDIDGVLFNSDMTNLIFFPEGKEIEDYTVPNGVEIISESAFKGRNSLKSIILPDSLKIIKESAFSSCKNLTEVIIPDGTEVIDEYAFSFCSKLQTLEIPPSVNYIGENSFTETKFYSNLKSESEDFIIINNILLGVNSSNTKIVVPSSVVAISGRAFSSLQDLTEVIIPDECIVYEDAFFDCTALKSITCGNNCTFNNSAFNKCSELSECTINGTVNINGNPFRGVSDDMVLEYDRPALDYKYQDNIENKSNIASSDIVNLDGISINSTISSSTGYNNGYWSVDDVQEIQDSAGKIYAAVKHENGVVIVPYDINEETIHFSKDDFKFGSAVFDDEDNIYIMWAKSISDNDIDKALTEEYANVVVEKYDKSGNFITEYGFPVNLMDAQFPYDAGNAHLGWKNNVLLVYFHTEWTKSSDGRHHQGSVATAVNTETSERIYYNMWQGSHAFGSCMILTDYGYAAIQMGDATARGINFNSYCLDSPEEFKDDYIANNGYKSLYHSSGQYGTNEHHLDGNTTYTHMGGIAKSNTTYAIAGKSERVYTSNIYKSSGLQTGNYDVFVRLCDQTLLNNVPGLAGESRIDEATEKIVDRNVVWLTECNETEKAGQVKIVTLEDGSYCVLWEKFIDGNFDSVRYVIMDECGNIIRRETAINNARLSDTSIQPVVYDDTLKWAVGSKSNNSLIWYTVNLNEFTTNKKIHGDANGDSVVNIADAVMLQKWLLGSCILTNWNNVDLYEDGRIDVFDMVEMRKLIVKGK
ncbi:MAG: leucine-rich repeat protein [Ruminococcus sp.]|nr:leucine-rich repeat protein [Ruminococcus sp.]